VLFYEYEFDCSYILGPYKLFDCGELPLPVTYLVELEHSFEPLTKRMFFRLAQLSVSFMVTSIIINLSNSSLDHYLANTLAHSYRSDSADACQ
jgi:hypothetical protein